MHCDALNTDFETNMDFIRGAVEDGTLHLAYTKICSNPHTRTAAAQLVNIAGIGAYVSCVCVRLKPEDALCVRGLRCRERHGPAFGAEGMASPWRTLGLLLRTRLP